MPEVPDQDNPGEKDPLAAFVLTRYKEALQTITGQTRDFW